jgi:hypothetical protein
MILRSPDKMYEVNVYRGSRVGSRRRTYPSYMKLLNEFR